MKNMQHTTGDGPEPAGEQGFMLLGLIVAIALILLALSAAATDVAFSLRREREEEAVRRGNQYVRAIQLYYRKNGHYPGTIEQLENTNNIRYLRQRYIDPMTGKDDWRMIAVGQNKTTVKGFFGQPLAGIASTGLGSAAGMASPGLGAGAVPGGATSVSSTGATTGAGNPAGAAAPGGTATTGTAGPTDTSGSTGAFGSTPGLGGSSGFGQSGSPLSGSTGPIMGVGVGATGNSLVVLNEQTTYQSWEFLYDPRIEKLKAAAALNSGIGSAGAGALGQTPGSTGQTGGFGQTPGGFGRTPGGFGQTPSGSSTPTTPTTPPTSGTTPQ
jgi:type II secretory pathway pseudopilin PulG